MPQFETSFFIGEIFWLFISFGFLYVMMSGIICPMIEEVLSERDRFIKEGLEKADHLNRQADIIHQRHQVFLSSIEQEKTEMIQQELKEMRKEAHQQEEKNESALRRKVKQTENKIKAAKEKISGKADEFLTMYSDQLTQKLFGKRKRP